MAWDAVAASLVKIVEWRANGSVIVVGSVGQVESQIHSPAAAECNAASLRRDIATALRAAHEAGRRAGLAEAQKYALDAAIEAGWQDALAEASDKCATFVRERMSTAARIAEEPPELRGDREVWVRLKASEAQRCVDAIRALGRVKL